MTDKMQLLENVLSIVNVTRILLLGDFNLDQMLQENVNKMHRLTQRFHLHQRSQYFTHVQGGILVLIFDSRKSESVLWIPSPLWSNGLVVMVLDSQSRGPMFKTTGRLQGRLNLSSFRGR